MCVRVDLCVDTRVGDNNQKDASKCPTTCHHMRCRCTAPSKKKNFRYIHSIWTGFVWIETILMFIVNFIFMNGNGNETENSGEIKCFIRNNSINWLTYSKIIILLLRWNSMKKPVDGNKCKVQIAQLKYVAHLHSSVVRAYLIQCIYIYINHQFKT